MPKLLFDESPMIFQRTLASWIGLNEAIALQELNYKLKDVDGERVGKIVDGIKWYRNSIQEWHTIFTFWDTRTITRAFATLEEDGLIISKVFSGRCKWYTVDYNIVEALTGPLTRMQAIKDKRKKAGDISAKKAKDGNRTKCHNDKVSEYNMTKCPTSKTPSKDTINTIGKSDDLPPEPIEELPVVTPQPIPPIVTDPPIIVHPKMELLNYFLDYTKIKEPTKGENGWWYSRLNIILDLSDQDVPTGKKLIKQAVDKLRGDDLTVSDPGSLIKTIRALIANGAGKKVRMTAV